MTETLLDEITARLDANLLRARARLGASEAKMPFPQVSGQAMVEYYSQVLPQSALNAISDSVLARLQQHYDFTEKPDSTDD